MSDKSSSHRQVVSNQDSIERLSVLLQSKKVDWEAVKGVFAAATHSTSSEETAAPGIKIPDGLYHDALSRACLDTTVDPETLRFILPGRINRGLPTLLKIKFVIKAARCDNTTACQALVQPTQDYAVNNQILSWNDQRGNNLLHLVCAENGWNSAIAYLLDATLEPQHLPRHDWINGSNNDPGLFQHNDKRQCPLWLALEAGADIAIVLQHMRQHRVYLKENLELLIKIMAEYCTDMTALDELLEEDPNFFDGISSGDLTPLYHACYYQNPSMIRCLLRQHLRQRGEKRKKLLKKLMLKSTTRKAPLTMLVLGVGRSDPGNSIECIQVCQDILGTFPVLHYTLEEALWTDNEEPGLSTKQCLQTIQRMIAYWQIHMLSLDDKKRSILSLLITKQQLAARVPVVEESIRAVLEDILTRCPDAAFARDKRKRLPLHLACEAGWQWSNSTEEGGHSNELLAQLIRVNPSALEVMDPKFKVYPFALVTDLTTIYCLLRYQPGVIRNVKTK